MATRRDVIRDAILGGLGAMAAGGLGGAQMALAQDTPRPPGHGVQLPRMPVLHVPARDLPSPPHLNPVDRDKIARPIPDPMAFPHRGDVAAWRTLVRGGDHLLMEKAQAVLAAAPPATVREVTAGSARVFVIEPQQKTLPADAVILDIHGGALIFGGGDLCRDLARGIAAAYGATVWAVDYRMPPDHPYPAGLDDCVAAYRALLEAYRPERIVLKGDSAGGNLAAALLLRIRDAGLPMPAGCLLFSPELDLTETGDSFRANLGIDPLGSLLPVNLLYAGTHPLVDPYVSPIFARVEGFPPTLLVTGTRDIFLSNSVRLHRSLRDAGVYAELHVMEAIPHGGYSPGTPEAEAQMVDVRRFLTTALTPREERGRALSL
ncbi:hypothetical protein GCM10007301_09400 [Azorhizobium oxalatiphilum]|uniref:Alpha/beta hydrolase fold-3 domain-containing protein n=1 Tax=Azorhizobium oxalatiphilum TaxID=980631 RepID=A0A917F4L2_9HYPH|nr:alpha/beta hydrolase [Azorhizobium oxalatiphilum]GGF52056.1 hypothetical protein GCM10007301_09400 [Azorhizobium oxalatiphilum]